MKKLMIAAAVVGAMGLSLFAIDIGGVDFEDRDIGKLDISIGDGPEGGRGDTLWTRTADNGDSEVVQGTAEPNTSKYLKIDESDVLERKLATTKKAIPNNGGISVVSKVQFTAQDAEDDAPTVASGSKLAIWMKKVISGNTTNNVLVVTANATEDYVNFSSTNYEFSTLSLQENTWYDLEVKAETRRTKLATALTGFIIKINGTTLTNPDEEGADSNIFWSLDQESDDLAKIASIGFKGTGAADDLVFSDYINELPVDVGITGNATTITLKTLTYQIDSNEAVEIKDELAFSYMLSSVTTSLKIHAEADGYKNFDKTYTPAELVGLEEIEVNLEADKTPTEKFLEDIENATAGGTVTATGDIELTAPIQLTKGLTLDLGGYTLDAADGYTTTSFLIWISDGTTTTITNGTIDATTVAKPNCGIWVCGSTLNLAGVEVKAALKGVQVTGTSTLNVDATSTIKSTGNDAALFVNTQNGDTAITTPSTITIAGKVLNTYDQWPASSRKAYAISLFGNDTAGANVTIADGAEIKSDNMTAIYFPAAGSLTINAATVEGTEGVYVKSGTTAVVKGATIKGTLTSDKVEEYVTAGDGFKNTGDAFVVDNANYPAGTPSVTISGGTFTAVAGKAVASYGATPITGFITGGTFSSDPTALCVAGKKGVENAGTWTIQDIVYATLSITPVENCTIVVSNATEEVATDAKFDKDLATELTVYRTPAAGYELDECTATEVITMSEDRTVTAKVKAVITGFVIEIAKSTGISSFTATVGGEPYTGAALATGTKLVVTLVADSAIKFPIYKLAIGELGAGVIDSATYEYTVADAAATLTFTAEAAAFNDPNTTADDVVNAVANTASPENAAAAKAKVENIAGSDKAAAQDVASWMATKSITADQLAGSDYTQASYALKTDTLLTSATEVEVDSIDAADGTVAVTVKIDDKDATKEEVEQYVQLSNDLSDATTWAALPVSTLKSAVTIEDGKIVITPVSGIDKLFLKVVIPQDPVK